MGDPPYHVTRPALVSRRRSSFASSTAALTSAEESRYDDQTSVPSGPTRDAKPAYVRLPSDETAASTTGKSGERVTPTTIASPSRVRTSPVAASSHEPPSSSPKARVPSGRNRA